jgi:hypothetical protein
MHVLVLASPKGGSGKTTLSGHLAVEADQANIGPVALIDTDPQGSLSHWWNARAASSPHFAKVGLLPPIAFTLDLPQLTRFLHHALPLRYLDRIPIVGLAALLVHGIETQVAIRRD